MIYNIETVKVSAVSINLQGTFGNLVSENKTNRDKLLRLCQAVVKMKGRVER